MAGRPRLTEEQRLLSKEKRREWDRKRHAKDKHKRNESRRIAHSKNPERLRKIDRERYAKNPYLKKKSDLKYKYGEDAVTAWNFIKNCQSCGDFISGKNKHIDHDHKKPKNFRGVLCSNCNIALGHLKDDTSRIVKLLVYLTNNKRSE